MSGYIGTQPVPQATQTRDVFTATSGQTSFATSGYTPNFLDCWLNGVKLVNGDDFTATNGSDVVLTSGAAAGDTVEVLSYSTFEVNSQTFTGTTTLTGDLQATTATFSGAVTGTSATLSGGVYLGGTGSNNYLDDYEHGIYTVTITPATSGTVTLDTVEDSGTYVKIGNLVHVSAKIEVASVSSPVGTAFISLPFAVANVNENSGRISGSVAVQNIAFTGAYLTVFALEGNSHLQLQQVVSNGTWVALSASALGSGDDIQFTFTYRTTD